MSSIRNLELREVYTQCTSCEEIIDTPGLFDLLDNTMYIDCKSCKEEMVVWNWYDDWEAPD